MDSTEKPKKRRNSSAKKPTVTKESVTPLVKEESKSVMFITIEEHNEIINEKVSHNISLENGLRANEALCKSLSAQLSAQKFAEGKLKHDIEYAEKQLKRLTDNLNKIPTWIKKLFKAL